MFTKFNRYYLTEKYQILFYEPKTKRRFKFFVPVIPNNIGILVIGKY